LEQIFLCGAVGGWFYEYLAGIVPTSPGYFTIDIKPHISATLGPSSVEAVVHTVRGLVTSNWTRHTTTTLKSKGQQVLSLRFQIPAGVQKATVHVPLLGLAATHAEVKLQWGSGLNVSNSMVTLWHGAAGLRDGSCALSCDVIVGADGHDALELTVGAGSFEILVHSI
jgi:hypothetical protein